MEVWGDMKYWESGECQVVEEMLKDLDDRCIAWNPGHKNLYAALKAVPFKDVRVCIMGQDPYPESKYATGLAFSIPKEVHPFPGSLNTLFRELSRDLHCDTPTKGDLTLWCDQGVLLWNAVPVCITNQSLSNDIPEWRLLSEEIVRSLSSQGIVYALLGGKARSFASLINPEDNVIIETSHPSPRASKASFNPFLGSRIFSRINAALNTLGRKTIEWELA